MRVAEIYLSLQGEGILTGTPSVFVRASGCNLRCWFCDTPYASWEPEGNEWTPEAIAAHVARWNCPHVVLTGGEPMIFPDLVALSRRLREQGRHVTIETAGTSYLPVACSLMSISPKLRSSAPDALHHAAWHFRHNERRHRPNVIRRLVAEFAYQVKFVVTQPADCGEVREYLEEFPEIDRSRVWLMPEGTTAARLAEQAAWLIGYCRKSGFNYCPRRQIEWFGLKRGT
jgi:7-carboxy-7-deazaguanine synthase